MESRRVRQLWILLALALALSATLAACGSGGGATSAQVVMKNIAFVPESITVKVGTTVTWKNEDSVTHTVTSGTRANPTTLFKSGDVAPGGTFSFTFTQAGTYDYFCEIHVSMHGVVVVQ